MEPRLEILKYPDERLRFVAEEVSAERIKSFDFQSRLVSFRHFFLTLPNAVGLAATQVDWHERVIATRFPGDGYDRVMINPVIVRANGQQWSSHVEGCLSVPSCPVRKSRWQRIIVRFFDRYGALHSLKLRDFNAACVQHEVDHLNGRLIIDD